MASEDPMQHFHRVHVERHIPPPDPATTPFYNRREAMLFTWSFLGTCAGLFFAAAHVWLLEYRVVPFGSLIPVSLFLAVCNLGLHLPPSRGDWRWPRARFMAAVGALDWSNNRRRLYALYPISIAVWFVSLIISLVVDAV